MSREDTALDIHVYVDIDIVYEDFKRSIKFEKMQEKIPQIEEWLGVKMQMLRLRPSSRGNAHIELTFFRPLTVLENICVRAYLYDDLNRLILDLKRWLKTGDRRRVNVLWSGKYVAIDYGAEMHLCGQWEVWPIDRTKKAPVNVPVETAISNPVSYGGQKKIIDEAWPEDIADYKPAPIHCLKAKTPEGSIQYPPRSNQLPSS